MADTTISRSVGGTIGAAVAAMGGAAAAYWLYTNDYPIVAAIVAFFSLSFALLAVVGPRRADCPHCGQGISGVGGVVDRCQSCGEYSRTEAGRLVKVEPAHIASGPAFVVHVDQLLATGQGSCHWPAGCCVCGAPGVRTEELSLTLDTPGAVGHRLTMRFDIPHCAEHQRGADVEGGLNIRFRSHRYWREFCRLNGIEVRKAAHET